MFNSKLNFFNLYFIVIFYFFLYAERDGGESMNKRNGIIFLVVLVIVLGIGSLFFFFNKSNSKTNTTTNTDAIKFASEYTEVDENNVFVYKTVDEIIKIMEHGTGVVYLGYPECPWCQAYVRYLNEVAKEVEIDKIYYCNTKEVKENNMDKYYQLISILDGHLQYTNEGEQWIYVPNVSFHINGKIIGNNYETSKDTHNLKEPKEYWTEEEVQDLKNTLKKYMEEVYIASNTCTDCNK